LELIVSFCPAIAILRSANAVRPMRSCISMALELRAERACVWLPVLAKGEQQGTRYEQLGRALVFADHCGAVSTAWQYKTAARSTLLQHADTGATIALSHESVGWLRYQKCRGAEERICWSSGLWNPQDFSHDESSHRDDNRAWLPVSLLLLARTVGSNGRSWVFRVGRHPGTIEFSNEYFNSGKDAVHTLDLTGASLRLESERASRGRLGQRGERLGHPELGDPGAGEAEPGEAEPGEVESE